MHASLYFFVFSRELKKDKHRTRTTEGGNDVKFKGMHARLLLACKRLKCSSTACCLEKNAKFMKIDMSCGKLLSNDYFRKYESLRASAKIIPEDIIKEHVLAKSQHNGWVHIEVRNRACSLLQTGMTSNILFKERPKLSGFYTTSTTPGLWMHQ